MKYIVYLRTNLVNGKQYVGQTVNFENREYHWHNLKNRYAGKLIDNARKKYGTKCWAVEILKECNTQEDLNKWEMFYIKEYNTKTPNGYNLTDGGEGSLGYIVSEETRKKISENTKGEKNPFYGKHHSKETIEKLKNKIVSEETRKKMSEARKGKEPWMKGKHHTEDAKKKLSEVRKGKHNSPETEFKKGLTPWNTGKHLSEETKKKISEAHKGRYVGDKNPMYGKKRTDLGKKVYQCTLEGEFIKMWNSPSECGRYGFNACSVRNCCKGGCFQKYNGEKRWYECTQHKGFKWMFKEDYEKMLGEVNS